MHQASATFCRRLMLLTGALLLAACSDNDNRADPAPEPAEMRFNRVAVFPACLQDGPGCDSDVETSAEIVAASADGNTLVYTDSPGERIGFVDITDPAAPLALGTLAMGGEPTSIARRGGFMLVAVNTSPDFVNVSGELVVVDIASRTERTRIALGGQPDSVAVSPDGVFAAVVIENERDEDLGDGAPPQLPAGELVIVDLQGNEPAAWTTRRVDLSGIADRFPGDPEPEYVDINAANVAAVTLQENNHVVLVNLADGSIAGDFSAGTVDLDGIDTTEEKPARILQTESLAGVAREPDGVTWISNSLLVTADEGDLDGGSRGFTVFDTQGNVVFSSGNAVDRLAARIGHYPDDRSGNKGSEPENVDFGRFGDADLLFVVSERGNFVAVYDIAEPASPRLLQVLPAGVAPEGVLALPSRNLLVAASEKDDRGDGFRAVLNIYRLEDGPAQYPTLMSADRVDGAPIPWGALSGLAAAPSRPDTLFAVDDSFYQRNRIFTLDIAQTPARLTAETFITDPNGVFAALPAAALADPGVGNSDPARIGVFDEADRAALVNDDGTVNLDPEGIAVTSDGGFWIASEGAGTAGDAGRPVNSLNFVVKTDAAGVVQQVFTLPQALNDAQLRFGFEGVAEYSGRVYVAFQRVWPGDSNVRIGVLDPATGTWTFLFYPLDAPASQNGGWVGLSDLTALGGGRFAVIERDNQAGPDAAIKRLYTFDVTGLADGGLVTKTLARDLLPDLAARGGLILEKIEGLAVTGDGDVWIVNDNDGVDDSNGETQLIRLGNNLF